MFYDQNLDTAIHSVKYLMAAPKNNLSLLTAILYFPIIRYINQHAGGRLHGIPRSYL